MIPSTELLAAEQWSSIRQNADYQRAFDETMSILLAETKPLETILSVLARPRVAQESEEAKRDAKLASMLAEIRAGKRTKLDLPEC